MARKYEVTVTGEGTHGAFTLFCAPQDGGPVWCSGMIPVSATPGQLINTLMPGMDARVEMGVMPDYRANGDMTTYPPDRDHGPKSWIVTLEGQLYAGLGRDNGGDRLFGMNSPGLTILDLGHVDDRRPGAGIETPATARPVS